MSLRQERLKKEFFKIIKEFFLYQVNNPLLKNIIIREVVVSRDLSYIKVYYQTDGKNKDDLTKSLQKVIPVIKSSITKHINLRKVPNIVFALDDRSEYTQKVNSILNKITYSDQSTEELIENYKNLNLEDLWLKIN